MSFFFPQAKQPSLFPPAPGLTLGAPPSVAVRSAGSQPLWLGSALALLPSGSAEPLRGVPFPGRTDEGWSREQGIVAVAPCLLGEAPKAELSDRLPRVRREPGERGEPGTETSQEQAEPGSLSRLGKAQQALVQLLTAKGSPRLEHGTACPQQWLSSCSQASETQNRANSVFQKYLQSSQAGLET